MKSRLADAATERLGNVSADEPPITEAEMMGLLASGDGQKRPMNDS